MAQAREKLSILLADDDEDDVCLFREVAEDFTALSLIIAQNGNQVLASLSAGLWPNIIILDINMPQMNGLDCLKHLNNEISAGKLSVIMFSTSGDERNIELARKLGARAYFKKPTSYRRHCELIEIILREDWSIPELPFMIYL